MRVDVRTLQTKLRDSQLACVLPGIRDTTQDVYPAVKDAYPGLCDDSLRCDDVCSQGNDQPEWKHAVRRVQQQLKREEHSRVTRRDGEWFYHYPALYLQPVSDDWIDRFEATVQTPVTAQWASDVPAQLEPVLPARLWGTTETESPAKQSYIDRLRPHDHVLYYHDGDFIAAGRVGRTYDSSAIGDWLWETPASRWVYTVTDYHEAAPSIDHVWDRLDYGKRKVINGFLRVDDAVTERLRTEFGSIEDALFDELDGPPQTDEPTLESAGTESPSRRTTEQDRIQRDRELVNELKALYDCECQVCGRRLRQSPKQGYAEVHHLQPLGAPHDGPDTPGNMLVLCPNHHADFDHGVIEVDPDELFITHHYDEKVTGMTLTLDESHPLNDESIEYHNRTITKE